MTIRRDLQKLEQQGAVCWCPEASSLRDAWRMNLLISKNCAGNDAKSGYWQAGGKSVQPGSCIYLDAGTTTLAIAHI